MAKICRVMQIKLESVSLRKCPYDHRLANKVYLSAITLKTFFRVFTYKMAAKINWHRHGTNLLHYHPMYTQCRLLLLYNAYFGHQKTN